MHANNCVGQNKNKTVIAYLCWRVVCGLSEELTLSFMRVGHTRCSVDAKFGRLKQSFRKSDVDSVADVVTAVAEGSATITVTTTDRGFTATSAVTVSPVAVT